MTYEVKTNIYIKDKGPLFGRTLKINVEATSPINAIDVASVELKKYCDSLKSQHGIEFYFNELDINEIEE